MRQLVKADRKTCKKCKYHTFMGNQPTKTNDNICCDYWNIEGHSRVFENGYAAYDPAFCDKFDTGKRSRNNNAWNRDNMTMWRHKCESKEELRKHEYEENYYY